MNQNDQDNFLDFHGSDSSGAGHVGMFWPFRAAQIIGLICSIGYREEMVEKNLVGAESFKSERLYFVRDMGFLFFSWPFRCQSIWFLISLIINVLMRLWAISVALGSSPVAFFTKRRTAVMASCTFL